MPIFLNQLQNAYARSPVRKSMSLAEAKATLRQTAFLCHSHKDRTLAEGLQTILSENGWNVYIDWQDAEMPEKPTKETATKIKIKIGSTDWFIYLATANSSASKWCPWEIGFADATKPNEKIIVVAVSNNSITYGQEYLALYRQLSETNLGGYAVFEANTDRNGTPLRSM